MQAMTLSAAPSLATDLDVNREHPFQSLRPGHAHTVFGARCITGRGVSVKPICCRLSQHRTKNTGQDSLVIVFNTYYLSAAQIRLSPPAPMQMAFGNCQGPCRFHHRVERCQPAFLSMLRYLYLSHSET
jgi:hypothetical protein